MKEPSSGSSAVADLCSSPHFLVTRPNRTTVKVLYDPKSAPLSSSSPSMEDSEYITRLTVETHGGNVEVNDSAAFGRFLQEVLPNVTSIQYRTCILACEEDELLFVLSQYPPPKLSALTIYYLHFGEYHNFCLDKSSSFPNLQSFSIRVANFYSPTKRAAFSRSYFQSLGRFLMATNNLQQVSLCNVTAKSDEDNKDSSQLPWTPVIDALRSNPGLKQISITHRHGDNLYPYNDPETMEAIQFGPRIQQAKKLLLSDDATTKDPMQASCEQWMQALLSVRDRPDCVEYFLSHYPAESIRPVQEILERGL